MWEILVAASLVLSPHVRSTDPVIAPVLAETMQRSAVVQRLVDIIEESNVVVYLARGECPRRAVGCLMMGGGGAGMRYVRINIPLSVEAGSERGWNRAELSIAIAHELQHAAEVARWPEVVDGPSLEAAYLRRGLDRGGRHLDTDGAVNAGDARRQEIRSERRR